MSNNGSYSNNRPSSGLGGNDIEYPSDPASGSFFVLHDYKKHEDLKQMLDMNKDSVKLEAMKRIIGMVAKGRDTSNLFPAVVKNVVSKNIEVKKLVYVYLVRYAEEQQDLALLSISTFQRALKDPNQLIRASALRVLSSIRVSVIVPIVMLAIRDSASDMSPYVRKTAAHAIPKLHSLDPEQKDELVLVIEKLLSDRTTLVVGSAVMAFEEVCPERIDLVHRHFRKLCNLLVDVDEWGQVLIINMLTRYARTQFADPNLQVSLKTVVLKLSHCVVMSVCRLYHHLAPRSEVGIVTKSLIRLLRSHREVQSVVLNCIASMSLSRKGLFKPYLKSFFVRSSDPTHIKLLKLEILTNLATETSISFVLREFQTYVSSTDKEFVAATIQAIGRCAANIREVTDNCLDGLVAMLSGRDEAVVAESVVVIRKLLQSQPARHKDIVGRTARLLATVTVPQARASILWLLGEYCRLVPNIAPDVLRSIAKTFTTEEDIVKLQALNLAVKLYLTNPEQTTLLCQYIFSLARYDQNYDIRDRSRFLRQFVFPITNDSSLSKHAVNIFLASKPAPLLKSKFKDRERFQLGSLSHYIDTRAAGYHDLPDFPEIPPDPTVRDVPEAPVAVEAVTVSQKSGQGSSRKKKKSFYSDSDSTAQEDNDDDDDEESSSSEEEESSSDAPTDDDDDAASDVTPTPNTDAKRKEYKNYGETKDEDEESSDESSSSSSDEDSSSEESSSEESTPTPKPTPKQKPAAKQQQQQKTERSNLDLLLDLDDTVPSISTPVMTPSLGGFLTPLVASGAPPVPVAASGITSVAPLLLPARNVEVLNRITGSGLQVKARFTRCPHLYSPTMTSVELTFTNQGTEPLNNIHMTDSGACAIQLHDFAPITALAPGACAVGTVGIAWNDSTQPAQLPLGWQEGSVTVQLRAAVGELLAPVTMPETMFVSEQAKLKGMNEHSAKLSKTMDSRKVTMSILEAANLGSTPSSSPDTLRFSAQTMSSKSLVLVTIVIAVDSIELVVNCEKMVIGSMLLNELKSALQA
ncbi:AP-3 complex subunit beta-2-like [Nilaparvata lugens]|uniref:AP-3 complex subunit beta-2-like n=1 Tax=Nilaparvata lugens TaxID=108931 RepID=UPI00193CBFF2|nr:AP-3 complex subunit beta-2-like [Nilaparvata lugens]